MFRKRRSPHKHFMKTRVIEPFFTQYVPSYVQALTLPFSVGFIGKLRGISIFFDINKLVVWFCGERIFL